MNVLSEEEMTDIVDVVCKTVLDRPVSPGGSTELHAGEHMTASIAISGAWNGVVKVRISVDLLDRAAAGIFSIAVDEVRQVDRVDTITELTNMLGGTVKCMLPESCDLALPEIVSERKRKRDRHDWAYFHCDAMSLAVAIIDYDSGSGLPDCSCVQGCNRACLFCQQVGYCHFCRVCTANHCRNTH